MEERKTQEFVVGEDAEDQNALSGFEGQGTGFPVPGQHALPVAPTVQSAETITHCSQDNLPTPDRNTDNNVLGKGRKDQQHSGCTYIKAEQDVKHEVIEEESQSQRTLEKNRFSCCNSGTLEGQRKETFPKSLLIKVLERRTIIGCHIHTTFMGDQIIKIYTHYIFKYSINYILNKV